MVAEGKFSETKTANLRRTEATETEIAAKLVVSFPRFSASDFLSENRYSGKFFNFLSENSARKAAKRLDQVYRQIDGLVFDLCSKIAIKTAENR